MGPQQMIMQYMRATQQSRLKWIHGEEQPTVTQLLDEYPRLEILTVTVGELAVLCSKCHKMVIVKHNFVLCKDIIDALEMLSFICVYLVDE